MLNGRRGGEHVFAVFGAAIGKLSLVEKNAPGSAGSFFDNSHSSLAKVFGKSHFSRKQAPVEMHFLARFARAELALLSWHRQAYRTTHSHYLSRRKFFGYYHRAIQS